MPTTRHSQSPEMGEDSDAKEPAQTDLPSTGMTDPAPELEQKGDSAPAFGPTAVLTPANLITFARVAAIPPLIYLILTARETAKWWPFVLWIAIMMSDLVDGFLARKQGTTTSGAYLDPLADKIAVIGTMAALTWLGRLPWLALLIIAAREIAVSLFRSYASRKSVTVPATPFGKAKTFSQSIAVGVLLLPPLEAHPLLGAIAIWIAVGFTVASGLDYLRRGSNYLSSASAPQPPVDSGRLEGSVSRRYENHEPDLGNVTPIRNPADETPAD